MEHVNFISTIQRGRSDTVIAAGSTMNISIIPWNILQNWTSSVKTGNTHRERQNISICNRHLFIDDDDQRKEEALQEYIIHLFDSFKIMKRRSTVETIVIKTCFCSFRGVHAPPTPHTIRTVCLWWRWLLIIRHSKLFKLHSGITIHDR